MSAGIEGIAEAIAQCVDAKTLIGLMWLERRLNGPLHPQGHHGGGANPQG